MEYTWEVGYHREHPKTMGIFKEDEYIMADRDCIQNAIGFTWWVWEEGSRYFFWGWTRYFCYEIRDGKNQCKVLPWPRFFQPQRDMEYEYTIEKETRNLTKARRQGYIST